MCDFIVIFTRQSPTRQNNGIGSADVFWIWERGAVQRSKTWLKNTSQSTVCRWATQVEVVELLRQHENAQGLPRGFGVYCF